MTPPTTAEHELHLVAHSPDAAATQALGRALGERLLPGQVVTLQGELGAGKTHFVKGLAEALGFDPDRVTSPTFTLVNEYRGGRLPLYHVDLYRISRAAELDELGLDELLGGDGVGAVEWIDRFPEVAPREHVRVTLQPSGEDARELILRARGPGVLAVLREPPAGWGPAAPPR